MTEAGIICGLPVFTRIDTTPIVFAASSQSLATRIPSRRDSSLRSAILRGALFDMCTALSPDEVILFAS
jgi:hypothetical protein